MNIDERYKPLAAYTEQQLHIVRARRRAIQPLLDEERLTHARVCQRVLELRDSPFRSQAGEGIERAVRVVPQSSTPTIERGGCAEPSTYPFMTLDRFWEALHCWIIDGYTQEVQHGVGGSPDGKGIPARLWLQALESNFVPCLPLKSAEAAIDHIPTRSIYRVCYRRFSHRSRR